MLSQKISDHILSQKISDHAFQRQVTVNLLRLI